MGGGLVPYLGFVEMHLQIPGVKKFDEDVLMRVLDDSPHGDQVPVQMGTLHIGMVIDLITQEEIDVLTRKWKRGRIATLLADRAAVLKGDMF